MEGWKKFTRQSIQAPCHLIKGLSSTRGFFKKGTPLPLRECFMVLANTLMQTAHILKPSLNKQEVKKICTIRAN